MQLLAQAEATGSQIRLTHFAVGDGAGYPIIPNANMTGLVRERFRATVNRVYQDPENENKFTAEIIIPVSVGGFVMREIGVFDSNGNLVIVGNIPDTQNQLHRMDHIQTRFTAFRLWFQTRILCNSISIRML